jgi:hypothetical protein
MEAGSVGASRCPALPAQVQLPACFGIGFAYRVESPQIPGECRLGLRILDWRWQPRAQTRQQMTMPHLASGGGQIESVDGEWHVER